MKNKVVLIGPNAVGKSALAVQFVQKQFLSSYDPTIEDIYHIQHKVSKKVLDIELIDTSGTEQFSALKENYLRSGSLILLVFSLSSNRSFQTIQNILTKYKSNFELLPASSVILIGNKSDEEREVPTSEVEKLLQFNNFAYIETSAKTNANINECLSIIKNFHEQRNRKEIDATSSSPKAIRKFHLLKSKLQSAKLFDH